MDTKKCVVCEDEKERSFFYPKKGGKHGLEAKCIACSLKYSKASYFKHKEKRKEYAKEYAEKNRDALYEKNKAWREKNSDHVKSKRREWYYNNREYSIKKACEWSKNNSDRRNARALRALNEKRKIDPVFRLKANLRCRIYFILKQNRISKNQSSIDVLGADFLLVKEYIEKQFKKGMTWENYGEWHIDHIIPFKTARTEDDVLRLCHYTNLQPMWGRENMSKGGRILSPVQLKITI